MFVTAFAFFVFVTVLTAFFVNISVEIAFINSWALTFNFHFFGFLFELSFLSLGFA